MPINDMEKRLDEVFDEFTEYYILRQYQQQFRESAFIAGGSLYDLANGREPKDFDFFISDKRLVSDLINDLKSQTAICSFTNNALSFDDGKYQIIVRYVGTPEEVVSQFDFKHNMFYFYRGRVAGLVEWSYLKTKRLVFNAERARDLSGILLRIPKFVQRGMSITAAEHAKIIEKLCRNFDDNEVNILSQKQTYGGVSNQPVQQGQTQFNQASQPQFEFRPAPQPQFAQPQPSQFGQQTLSKAEPSVPTAPLLPF